MFRRSRRGLKRRTIRPADAADPGIEPGESAPSVGATSANQHQPDSPDPALVCQKAKPQGRPTATTPSHMPATARQTGEPRLWRFSGILSLWAQAAGAACGGRAAALSIIIGLVAGVIGLLQTWRRVRGVQAQVRSACAQSGGSRAVAGTLLRALVAARCFTSAPAALI